MQSKTEKIVGNIFAIGLTLFILFVILHSIFNLMFGDIKGFPIYGNRGDSYIYDDYN